jgi:hypothetical protein
VRWSATGDGKMRSPDHEEIYIDAATTFNQLSMLQA